MRIIAGTYRSRKLVTPPGLATRPTSDRLRERLFNVLQIRIPGAVVADLYAGCGAVGLEALSRGARMVCFAEIARPPLLALRQNMAALGLAEDGESIDVDDRGTAALLRHLAANGPRVDVAFLDPPYEAVREYRETLEYLGEGGVLGVDGVAVAEHAAKQPLAERYGRMERYRTIAQGEAALSFYRVKEGSDATEQVRAAE